VTEGEDRIPPLYYLYTAWGWFVILFLTVSYLPFVLTSVLLCSFLDHDRSLVLPVNQAWCRWVSSLQPLWRHEVRGTENIDPAESYIIASNHLSAADIVLLAYIDVPFRWVAKHTVYLIPLFGWQLWLLGHLSIRRGDRKSRRRFIARAVHTLQAGMSILIFPEGTRSRDGKMRPFKPGGFLIAREAGKPILPVVISGTYDAMPPNSLLLRERIYAIFKILEPVEVKGKTREELDNIIQDVRVRMIREKEKLDHETEVMQERWLLSLRRR
jgi:1-acyl-sn-glycerol-3-phosphate acyltransferase